MMAIDRAGARCVAVGRLGAALGVVLAALAVGCGGPSRLTVDVKTDYQPTSEFETVRTEVSTTPFAGLEPTGTVRSSAASSVRPYVDGVRVAEFDPLSAGRYFARVSLVAADGVVLAQRVTDVQFDGAYALTVVVARSCADVRCPGADDDAASTACNGGRCVDPRCSPETPEFCGDPECTRDADCVAPGPCARAVCEGGACLVVPDDARCVAEARCSAAYTCEPLSPPDAGPPDAGADDAGPDDTGPPCATREAACTDGLDEDCDGRTDCADADCGGVACDDAAPCTYDDVCVAAEGACRGSPVACIDDACGARTCNGTATCALEPRPGAACADDGNACTSDLCDAAGACTHAPVVAGTACADDGNACTSDVCDASGACTHPGVRAGTTCASDGNPCTTDACDGAGACAHRAVGAGTGCPDDGNDCTRDVCDGAARCTHPAVAGFTACADDGNFCTSDVCDGAGRCIHPNWDGRRCLFGTCCNGACTNTGTDGNNCGSCGIRCPSGSTCDGGGCTCTTNPSCVTAGYGPNATCYMGHCQCVCTPGNPITTDCTGQCAGAGTCHQYPGVNYCYYP